MTQCIFCDATTNLNTQFSINLDGDVKVVVQICDAHAEDATVKTAKAAFLEKKKKIDELIAAAKSLGLNVTGMEQKGSLMVPVTETEKPAKPVKAAKAQAEVIAEDDRDVVSTEILDSRKGMVSVGGNTDHGYIPGLPSHDLHGLKDKLPEGARTGKAKMAMMEAREGMQIAIPEQRVDGLGTTRIKIAKVENDNKMQNRFKRMANESLADRVPNFARAGYQNSQVNCPMCNGGGFIKQGVAGGKVKEMQCPKCNGGGTVSTY